MSGGGTWQRDPVLGEQVWLARTGRGLPVRVLPTDRFRETTAVATFRYGSTDLGFVGGDGAEHRSPLGVAHYLEHKLFEDEAIQVFDRFARRGARVNAMTSFTKTSYHFTATSLVEENLRDLLHLVSHAHVTPENVEKERGIIAQEIRMYEDSPDYRLFFDFLGRLYEEHPVRHPVGGTVESIAEITPEELMTCYRTFYCTGNAALAVAGPVDPEAILELAEGCALREADGPTSICPEDLGPVREPRAERALEVSRSRVLLGFKDRTLCADPEERLRRELVTRVLLDRLFSGSSEIREDLRRRGLADDSLTAAYMVEPSFGFTVINCETDEPDRLIDALRDVVLDAVPVGEDYLERARRKMLGSYVRTFDSVKNLAFGQATEAVEGIVPFRAMQRMESLTVADVVARREEHFTPDAFAAAVVRRAGG